jgi:hypothetical protein
MDSTIERFPRRAARLRAGATLIQVAAAAGTSTNTAAKFELGDGDGCSPRSRAALAPIYEQLAAAAMARRR